MSKELTPYQSAIAKAKERFVGIAGDEKTYDVESIFAMQALMKTDFAMQTANKNPQSVHLAMINVASTGLTLNPAHGYAYLVPRDGAIVLDISYKGLIKIATDTGSVLWARAECVYEKDTFRYCGPAAMPEHEADPFHERGEIIGAYCIAKTPDGDILTEVMDRAAIEQVRSASSAWTRGRDGRKGPWEDYFSEMCRKAVIKRARKTWPYTDRHGRMALAVDLANQAEGGYTFEGTTGDPGPVSLDDHRKEDHDAALEQYQDAVDAVKQAIADEDWPRMTRHWNTIPQPAQVELWLAPSKGGTFTTAERKAIKERKVARLQYDRDTGEVLPAELQ